MEKLIISNVNLELPKKGKIISSEEVKKRGDADEPLLPQRYVMFPL